MNKKTLLNTCLATLLSLTSFTAMAEIITSDAYVRAVPPGSANTAAFVTITNKNQSHLYLTSASSNVADAVELHNHVMDGEKMIMRKIDNIELKAGHTVSLKSGSYHIMLINLSRDLEVGKSIDIELTFSDGTKQNLAAPVRNIMEEIKSHHHH